MVTSSIHGTINRIVAVLAIAAALAGASPACVQQPAAPEPAQKREASMSPQQSAMAAMHL